MISWDKHDSRRDISRRMIPWDVQDSRNDISRRMIHEIYKIRGTIYLDEWYHEISTWFEEAIYLDEWYHEIYKIPGNDISWRMISWDVLDSRNEISQRMISWDIQY